MKRPTHITLLQLALLCLWVWGPRAMAQAPLSNLVVTLGTTIQDSHSNNWSDVVIGSEDYQLLSGKQFAVYGKTGYPTNAGTYAFRANVFQQSNPNNINTLLSNSVSLGENLTCLSSALSSLFAEPPNTNVSNASYIPNFGSLALPQQVLTSFQAAAGNPEVAQSIGLLAHGHPGLLLCLGQGFAEIITNVTTYEVREINLATGQPAEVVGRVTVTPGCPIILPAPGMPFQVMTSNSTDNLRIRLRWGTSDQFRELSLLSFGFNVWRMPASTAVALGYNVTNPPMNELRSGQFVEANMSPVMAIKDFTTNSGEGGANDPSDGTTYFFSDNNGRPLGTIASTASFVPADYSKQGFTDGEQFYYFITAVDVLGRDGCVSPGGLAEACRRIPPAQPTNVVVQNTFHVLNAATLSNQQFLSVTWQQDLITNDDVTEYWVYRWPDPSLLLTNDTAPTNYRIAVVSQIPGSPTNYCQDNGAGAPMIAGTTDYWYSVRAVSQAACGPLLSPNSSAVWGVLRQRVGPGAASGELLGSCGSPAVVFQSFQTVTNTLNPSPYYNDYVLTVQRLDPGTAWAEFFVTNYAGAETTIGPVYFPPGNSPLEIPYSTPAFSVSNAVVGVACIVGSEYGLVSAPAWVSVTAVPTSTLEVEPVFIAGQIMLTSLTLTNPLLPAITGSGCLPAQGVTAYPDGTVRMTFSYSGPPPLMLIQAQTSNTWVDAGVAMADANGNYSIFYPACLLGPLPNFQGCPLNLPSEGDCSQHISAGAAGGAVNPIQITFTLTPGTAEFRLYRTVNNGPLTLIAQGAAAYNPSDTNATVVRTDDTMPSSVALLCYYVQLLDVQGNAGPLAFLGCKDVKPAQLPAPTLSQPQVAGTLANPQVNLNWFCPTSGIYRFEILVQRTDHPGIVPLSFSSGSLTPWPGFNTLGGFLGLLENLAELAQFDAAFLTPPTSAGFGPGPEFTLTADVITNATYSIAVAAMDDQGNAGPPSKAWQFTWCPPTNATPVPWPARSLPPVDSFDDTNPPSYAIQPRVQAVLLYTTNSVFDMIYPVGIRIGDLSPVVPFFPAENIGTTNFFSYNVFIDTTFAGPPPPPLDPNNMIFQRLSQNPQRNGNSLLPIVVYRQQVANAAYPNVSGAMIQVTPLIERLAYGVTGPPYLKTVTIYDLLIAGGSEVSGGKTGEFFYLRDQQPVLLGASYQYFVARMNAQREIAEMIPAGTITIPSTP